MSVSSSSPVKIAARCAHFGSCGGCSVQDVPYEDQLKAKSARVSGLLAPLDVAVDAAHPSPAIWFYRNKMEFSFGDVYPKVEGGPTILLGMKPKGRWYQILDLKECFLLSPETAALLAAVRVWGERERIPPYNGRRHEGLMRHLVVREAKNGSERMVVLVTGEGQIPTASFAGAVSSVYPATTVLWGLHGSLSDTAATDSLSVLSGPGHITEILRFPEQELKFRISPASFFQTNTSGAELLYGILRSWVRELKPNRVLDLYCGGGGITLSVAGVCGEAVGVELNESAVADARANAELNGIANAKFYSGDVGTLLPALLDLKAEVAIADPPRAGLHPKALQTLLDLGPAWILYVSCNPEALARDLGALKHKYSVERVEVVDLFPHTDHVETVVKLKRSA